MLTVGFSVSLVADLRFWALTPAVNLNFHSNTFEIEWLCFAVYVDVVTA